jgi:hypothetical protein
VLRLGGGPQAGGQEEEEVRNRAPQCSLALIVVSESIC